MADYGPLNTLNNAKEKRKKIPGQSSSQFRLLNFLFFFASFAGTDLMTDYGPPKTLNNGKRKRKNRRTAFLAIPSAESFLFFRVFSRLSRAPILWLTMARQTR
jgi:hypothetical protein